MRRLSEGCLYKGPLDGLERLARFLRCAPARLPEREGPRRRALVHAVMAAEKRLARGPKEKRWER